jgi:hypothetical protein
MQLLADLRALFLSVDTKPVKPWLKNSDIKKLLGISDNTIQRLRIAGQLRSTKLGGVHYYRYADIERLMNENFH